MLQQSKTEPAAIQPASSLSQMLRSRGWILAFVLALMFSTEFAVMLALPYVMPQPIADWLEALIDAMLLTFVCAPVLWWLLSAAKHAEEQRLSVVREAEAMRAQQMATLAQLATGVAHEIRNPLTSIKMLVQINRDKFAEEGLPTEDLELVEHEIRRMERSVHSLLEYARPETGEITLISIQEPLRRTLQLIESRCQTQHVRLSLDHATVDVPVRGDVAQLQQLLLNLCLNALDAMPEGGELSIRLTEQGNDVVLSVADTGSGIPAEMIDNMFTPFLTSKATGVGLGLGICRRIAEAHQGTLTGVNRDPVGACFSLVLPRAVPPTN